MPSYSNLREEKPEQFEQMVSFVASLKEDMPEPAEDSQRDQAAADSK